MLTCPITGCGYATEDVDVVGAAALLNVHAHIHATTPHQATPTVSRAPKLERPKLGLNATTEDWNAFIRRWDTFRTGSGISDNDASTQLLECANEQLGNIILRADPAFTTRPLAEALQRFKSLAVIPVALGVLRADLAAMRQDPDEPFRTFAARVQGKAETCEFKTTYRGNCSANGCDTEYSGHVYYTDEVVRDVLLNGIADVDIRREALSADGMQQKPVNDVIAFIETRETARNANPAYSLSAVSEYRRSFRGSTPASQTRNKSSPSQADREKTAQCPDCVKVFHLFTKKSRGWNSKPHERCESCWKKRRDNKRADANSITHVKDDPFGQVSGVSQPHSSSQGILHHQIFNKGEWRRAQIMEHPQILLALSPDRQPLRSVEVMGIADTGAQSDLWSLEKFLAAGFKKDELSPVSLSLHAANRSPIKIDGAFLARLEGRNDDGVAIVCRTMIYVSRDVKALYLSYRTMLELGIINSNFPAVGTFSTGPSPSLTRGIFAGLQRLMELYAAALKEHLFLTDRHPYHLNAPLTTMIR